MKSFKASFKYLIPVLSTLIVSGGLGGFMKIREIEVESLTVFPETPTGAALNSSLFIIMVVAMAGLLYGLIKYGFHRIVLNLIRITLIAAVFSLLLWYSTVYIEGDLPFLELWRVLASGLIAALLVYGIYKGGITLQIGSAAVIASLIGGFLGSSIPLFSSFALLLGLSIYDVISVYKGPIGKIAERTDISSFLGAVVNYDDLTIGMGDLVFYAMLINSALLNLGVQSMLAASAGILGGSYLALKMLEKKEIFPGLPLPLISGMALALAFTIS